MLGKIICSCLRVHFIIECAHRKLRYNQIQYNIIKNVLIVAIIVIVYAECLIHLSLCMACGWHEVVLKCAINVHWFSNCWGKVWKSRKTCHQTKIMGWDFLSVPWRFHIDHIFTYDYRNSKHCQLFDVFVSEFMSCYVIYCNILNKLNNVPLQVLRQLKWRRFPQTK